MKVKLISYTRPVDALQRQGITEGLTITRLFMNGSLRSWIHYIELRMGKGTQREHVAIAKECAAVITEVFPSKVFESQS